MPWRRNCALSFPGATQARGGGSVFAEGELVEYVSVSELAPANTLPWDIYDAVTAFRLFTRGERFSRDFIRVLGENGIKKVVLTGTADSIDQLVRKACYREIDVNAIKPGTTLAFDIHGGDGSLLLARGTVLSEATLDQLKKRGVNKLYVRRMQDTAYANSLRRTVAELNLIRRTNHMPKVHFGSGDFISNTALLNERSIERMAQKFEETGRMVVEADAVNALMKYMRIIDCLHAREEKSKEDYLRLYHSLVRQTANILHHIRSSEKVNGDLLMSMAEQAVASLVSDRELLLGAIGSELEEGEDYLAKHAVNVAVVAANIASESEYSAKQIMELSFGALLSDIGMLRVADSIRFKTQPLTSDEQLEIMRHTLYGMDGLQLINKLPHSTPIVAYQSHERNDGSGYPHGKKAYGIHDFAKIVAVADVYHAQIARRPWRQHATLPYQAIEEVLKMSASKKLDNRFCRSLLRAVSLFPVGSWVMLNNGECAQVLKANKDEFTKPVVAVLFDADGNEMEVRRVDLADQDELKVIRPARMDDAEPLAGF
ncbi:MAG: hypothetical protein JXR97_17215 [Planctomycetes bacterium]|nr:hypothetical protein [Planctomycetota bacterium]